MRQIGAALFFLGGVTLLCHCDSGFRNMLILQIKQEKLREMAVVAWNVLIRKGEATGAADELFWSHSLPIDRNSLNRHALTHSSEGDPGRLRGTHCFVEPNVGMFPPENMISVFPSA